MVLGLAVSNFNPMDTKHSSHRSPRRDRGPRSSSERPKPEYDHKIVDIRRVARVVAGGRRFSFSVTVVIGDRKGKVGVGIGKASDTSLAIEKAIRNAKKNLCTLPLTKTMSIPHEVTGKFAASSLMMKPAPGRGIVAGGSVRSIFDLAGIRDAGAKILSRSKNKLNNARAAIVALRKLRALKRPSSEVAA